MPSEIAKDIVDKIFGDDKAKALDLTNDALSASLLQARLLELGEKTYVELIPES